MDKTLDGKKLADMLNSELTDKINKTFKETGTRPGLATILVGQNTASQVYVNIKHKTCAQVGLKSIKIELDENISKDNLIQVIHDLNKRTDIHGILLQLPLPSNLRPDTPLFLGEISFHKDVDGFHPINRGKLFDYDESLAPCTPKGIIALLEHYDVELKGKDVTIINRSNLLGKPLFLMLLKRDATVSVCHTSTKNIERYMKQADILILGVGKPRFVTGDTIKEGSIIIDAGINRVEGKLCGDVDFDDVIDKCSKITPVPGGVGPLTVSFLLQNTYFAFLKQLKLV